MKLAEMLLDVPHPIRPDSARCDKAWLVWITDLWRSAVHGIPTAFEGPVEVVVYDGQVPDNASR